MSYNEFTVILPTLNEAKNVGELIKSITSRYNGIAVIVSDDGSKDNTKEAVSAFGDPKIIFYSRKEAAVHGLSASILDASRTVKSKYFIVMDADNQRPWSTIRHIAEGLKQGSNLVIASRKRVEGYWPRPRKYISYLGNVLGRVSLLIRKRRYFACDVLTGFFGVETKLWEKAVFAENKNSGFRLEGYKVLFDFLKILPRRTRIKNIQYVFNARKTGASKLNNKIYIEYLKAIFF